MNAQAQRLARLCGALLLLMAVCAGFAELGVRTALVVPGDAAATAANILAAPLRFRLGFAAYLIAFLLDVPVAVLLYTLLAPSGRLLALLTTSFRLVYAAIVATVLLAYAAAGLLLLGPSPVPGVADAQGLALFCLAVFGQGFSLALVFFGVHLVLLGGLLYASRVVPRVLGALVVAAGCSYLVGSFSLFLAPALHARIAPLLAVPAMFELLLALWLIARGVSAGRITSA